MNHSALISGDVGMTAGPERVTSTLRSVSGETPLDTSAEPARLDEAAAGCPRRRGHARRAGGAADIDPLMADVEPQSGPVAARDIDPLMADVEPQSGPVAARDIDPLMADVEPESGPVTADGAAGMPPRRKWWHRILEFDTPAPDGRVGQRSRRDGRRCRSRRPMSPGERRARCQWLGSRRHRRSAGR